MSVTRQEQHSVEVAVAVICYQTKYLLAFRNSKQHQGDRYEFVGGKMETGESAKSALIREVTEEIGLNLQAAQLSKLGRIVHDYGDKRVRLHIYKAALSPKQFEQFVNISQGLEGQPLRWVDRLELINGKYPLPAANLPILAWLSLPKNLVITYPFSEFQDADKPIQAWVDYHTASLPTGGTVYLRPKAETLTSNGRGNTPEQKLQRVKITLQAIGDLLQNRADLNVVLPDTVVATMSGLCQLPEEEEKDRAALEELFNQLTPFFEAKQIIAQQLSHHTLLQIAATINDSAKDLDNLLLDSPIDKYFANLPVIVSCHDLDSIQAANQLAQYRIHSAQAPVIGVFISPVIPTRSHPEAAALGWSQFSELAQFADMPVIALGGLSPKDLPKVQRHGGIAVAGIRKFIS